MNLKRCSSIWSCPVCLARVSERRRIEIETGIKNFLTSSHGPSSHGRIVHCVFTLQHHAEDSLKLSLNRLNNSFSEFCDHRQWSMAVSRFGIEGYIKSFELTKGVNGWHPHLHVAFFFDNEIKPKEVHKWMRERWISKVQSQGGLSTGLFIDFRREMNANNFSDYLTKNWNITHELTKSNSKSKSMNILIYKGFHGDNESCMSVREYIDTMRGKRMLRWSKGLKDKLGIDDKEDEAINEQETGTRDLFLLIDREEWEKIVGNELRSNILNMTKKFGLDDTKNWLHGVGIEAKRQEVLTKEEYGGL